MHIEHISNLEALFGMLAFATFAALIFHIVPPAARPPEPRVFSEAEVVGHDWALPKYLVVTTGALTLGALHLAIRSIPAVANWLAHGGYGGHLVRDIAYSHMMIVMGGTIAVTGLTWYALPRVLRRPLYSGTLAELAFWGTVVGAAGFYVSNIVAGGVMAGMANAGVPADVIDYSTGLWRGLAIGISATVMGLGYWTYVANVFLTALGGDWANGPRPHLHLAKFFIVGAAGLFVGTIQGVLQVLPENVDWLHAAGVAGTYIDPLSHAHVNLITGVISIIAGIIFFITANDAKRPGGRFAEELVFWTLVPGSVIFYLSFLYLGFEEGSMIVNRDMSFAQAAQAMGWLHTVPLAISGTVTLAGIWLLIVTTIRRMCTSAYLGRGGLAAILGASALAGGTLQGIVQVVPAVRIWMIGAGEVGHAIAEAHAQLNIVGGVLLLLLSAMLVIGEPLTVGSPPAALTKRASILMALGAGIYYVSAILMAVFAGLAVHGGAPPLSALHGSQLWASPGMIAGALGYVAGAVPLLAFSWHATHEYRAEGWRRFVRALERNNTTDAPWRRRIPKMHLLLPEFVAGLFGFPGLGWILSGRATVGLPLILAGSAVSWAIIPLLLSPYGDGRMPHLTPFALECYLLTSAFLSTSILFFVTVSSNRYRASAGQAWKRLIPGVGLGAQTPRP